MNLLKMYINGQWTESESKEYIQVFDPSDYREVAQVPRGKSIDVNIAVQAARKTFDSIEWKRVTPHERGKVLYEIAQKIRSRMDELAELESIDVGKPLSQAYDDVEAAARYFEFYAGAADKILGETIPIEYGILDYTVREPVGVTAHIIPWNYPIQISSRSVAAAIACGNTVVMKPAEDTPLTALKLAELFDETDLPKGVFNVVTGLGNEAGKALASHPDINHITFTGSLQTGIAVMAAAAKNIVPVTLELGGKSPHLVFRDCNQEEAVNGIVKSIIQNAGQTCSAGARLIVEESVYEEVTMKIIDRFKKITIGPGKLNYDIGPIISKKQFERIQSFLQVKNKDWEILVGGNRVFVEGYESGYYMEPTLIRITNPYCEIAQEEIFGPVICVITFNTEEEAIHLANSTKYGLVTGIWTNDIKRAHRIASQVQSGQVFINNYGAGGGIQMPFGGYKKSGFGREKGLEALRNYTQLKNVAVSYF
jgi:aldehyde dehydrogenase (NAD+)